MVIAPCLSRAQTAAQKRADISALAARVFAEAREVASTKLAAKISHVHEPAPLSRTRTNSKDCQQPVPVAWIAWAFLHRLPQMRHRHRGLWVLAVNERRGPQVVAVRVAHHAHHGFSAFNDRPLLLFRPFKAI